MIYILVILTTFSTLLFSKDYDLGQVIVKSNKTDQSWIDTSGSAQIISGSSLDNDKDFLNVLRSNGIEVTQSGVNGNSSIYLRSFSGKYTIVMIDGIPVNDISNPNGEFNSAYLRNLNIERIEILKGAQSVLHGGALAGIVNIITKKTLSENSIYTTLGSYEYLNSGISYFNEFKNIVYQMVGDFETRSGPSEASAGSEDDAYKNSNGLVSMNYQLGSKVIAKSYVQYTKSSQDFDKIDTKPVDSLNNHLQSSMLLAVQSFDYHLSNAFMSEVDMSLLKNTRIYQGSWVSNWVGEQLRIENRNHYHYKKSNFLLGFTHTSDQVDSNTFTKELNQSDVFIKNEIDLNPVKLEFGMRSVNHQTFGSKNLYQTSVGTKVHDLILNLNWGTSFRAPSISELHDPSSGNEDLSPESASSWELNLKQIKVDQTLQLSFFKQKIQDRIVYNTTLVNEGEYEVSGVELEITKRLSNHEFNFNTAYNNLENSKGVKALRVAYFKSNLYYHYKIKSDQSVVFAHRYSGERRDKTNDNIVKLDSYHLVDLAWLYDFKNYQLKLAANNIFNQSYFEIYGYQTLKRNYFLSLNKNF